MDNQSVARVGDEHTLRSSHQLAQLVYTVNVLTPSLFENSVMEMPFTEADYARLLQIGRNECLPKDKSGLPNESEIRRLVEFLNVPALTQAIEMGIHSFVGELDHAWYNFDHPLDLDATDVSAPLDS